MDYQSIKHTVVTVLANIFIVHQRNLQKYIRIPHYGKNKATGFMKPGHTFTIEPMIN